MAHKHIEKQAQHQQQLASAMAIAARELEDARAEVSRLRDERTRLIDLSNQLTAQVRSNSATAPPAATAREAVVAPVAQPAVSASTGTASAQLDHARQPSEVSVPASRLLLLEDSLARVTRQNAVLHDDLMKILARQQQQQQQQRQQKENAGDPGARDSGIAVDRRNSAESQSPGRLRLLHARRRLGIAEPASDGFVVSVPASAAPSHRGIEDDADALNVTAGSYRGGESDGDGGLETPAVQARGAQQPHSQHISPQQQAPPPPPPPPSARAAAAIHAVADASAEPRAAVTATGVVLNRRYEGGIAGGRVAKPAPPAAATAALPAAPHEAPSLPIAPAQQSSVAAAARSKLQASGRVATVAARLANYAEMARESAPKTS
jgi:hypothetical protein